MFSKFWIQTPLKEVIVDDDQLVEIVVVNDQLVEVIVIC